MATIGNTLRHFRQQRRMTQAEVAEAAKITQGTYSLYEADKAKPGIRALSRLADLFGVSVAVLDNSLLDVPGFQNTPHRNTPDADLNIIINAWNAIPEDRRKMLVELALAWKAPKSTEKAEK
jgi:transcriptional regulator with XRE-family HTH domain